MKPFFSDNSKNITLIEGEDIVSDDQNVVNTLNKFFGNSIFILDIKGYNAIPPNHPSLDIICSIISKFKNHPSVMKIREHVLITNKFSFCPVNLLRATHAYMRDEKCFLMCYARIYA